MKDASDTAEVIYLAIESARPLWLNSLPTHFTGSRTQALTVSSRLAIHLRRTSQCAGLLLGPTYDGSRQQLGPKWVPCRWIDGFTCPNLEGVRSRLLFKTQKHCYTCPGLRQKDNTRVYGARCTAGASSRSLLLSGLLPTSSAHGAPLAPDTLKERRY
jgi:hypothetical protein